MLIVYIGVKGRTGSVKSLPQSTRVCTGEKYAYYSPCSLELSKDNFEPIKKNITL